MKHLKITSAMLSAVMCMSMFAAPVAVIADETAAPEQTQTTEESETEAPKATEKPATKQTEKPAETEKPAPTEAEEQQPEATKKETEASEKTKPAETEKQEPSATEDTKPEETEGTKPSETEEQKPSETEPSETEETEPEETVPEVKPHEGPVTTARRNAKNEVSITKTQDNTCFGTSKISAPEAPDSEQAWKGSYVYFGTYDGEPIRFRVLAPSTTAYGGTTMFLDSDATLCKLTFDKNTKVWANSAIKSYLNGDFLDAFKPSELNAIAQSTRSAHSLETGTTGGKVSSWTKNTFASYVALKGERVFLLDAEEVSNVDYGYSVTNKSDEMNRKKTGIYNFWWLRSAGADSNQFTTGEVGNTGSMRTAGSYTNCGVAPALNINLSSVIFSTKISGVFGKTGAEYKLTLKDENLTITVPSKPEISGTKVSVPYTIGGSNKGTANCVSYLITNKAGTEIKYYNAMNGGTSGMGEFDLPSDLSLDGWGTNYEVYILAEQVNKSQTTDYASDKVKLDKPVVYSVMVNNGSATPATAKAGTVITITADAAPAGKAFDKWEVNAGTLTLTNATSSTTTFVMLAENVEITATYKNIAGYYSVKVNNGSASAETATFGATISITANDAPSGKVFDKWIVNAGSVSLSNALSSTTTFSMPAGDVEITATYKTVPSGHFIVKVNNGVATSSTSAPGLVVNVTANDAPAGMEFDKWEVVSGTVIFADSSSATTFFVMPAENVEITAKYKSSLSVKGKTATVKYSKVKKKNQTLAVSKVLTFVDKGQGQLTYAKVSGNSKILINKTTGAITVKKKLKKKTYTVKVKVQASGNESCNPSEWKTVTFKIKVK